MTHLELVGGKDDGHIDMGWQGLNCHRGEDQILRGMAWLLGQKCHRTESGRQSA